MDAAAWKSRGAADSLELTPVEAKFGQLRLSLAEALREEREAKGLTQAALTHRGDVIILVTRKGRRTSGRTA